MANRIGVNAELPHHPSSFAVVGIGGRSGKKKLCFSLGAVSFHACRNDGTNQDAASFFLGDDDAAFLNTKPLAQLRRQNYCTAVSDSYRFQQLFPLNA